MKSRILIAAAALAATVTGCSDADEPQYGARDRSVSVLVEAPGLEPERTRAEAVGTSRARLSAELYPAVSGEVVAVNFEPGQMVSAGDALIELDRRDEALAVELAELELADAERLLARYERSADSGAVLPTTLDTARTAAERARVELQRARVALEDRTIAAPFDGYVGDKGVDPGDRVTPSTLVTTVDDRRELYVSFTLPELFISELSVGQQVALETWSGNGDTVSGEIVDIGSRVDPATRTFTARARVPNDDDAMRPGMSFRVGVDVVGESYAVVPEVSVQWGTDGSFIWVVVDGKAVRTPVEIVQRRDGRVLIDGELAADSIIVVEGTQRMRDGVAVDYDDTRFVNEQRPATGAGGTSASAAL
ncbi:MAG: efflux RND transporter periplasmic adaptor subunit [Woeseiaceae bacterium]|nr:efflux RND transporter periplasmic adaptor subunit [Woeseiaceae bacterium]